MTRQSRLNSRIGAVETNLKVKAAIRRAAPLNYALTFPAVMASPPTITMVAPAGADPVTTSLLEAPFTSNLFTACGGVMSLETGQTSWSTTKENTSTAGQWTPGVQVIEFDWYDPNATPTFSVRFRNSATNLARAWVWVDGAPATAAPTQLTAAANGVSSAWLGVTMAAPGQHRIKLFVQNMNIGGIHYSLTAAIQAVRRPPFKLAVLGDSWVEGTGASSAIQAMYPTVGRILGADAYILGQGGTGYCNPGPGQKAVYGDSLRLSNLLGIKPDMVIVSGSSNDDTYASTLVGPAAAAVYSAIRVGLPKAVMFVVGPPALPNSNNAGRLANRDVIKAACIAAGGVFIDQLDPPGYLGNTPTWAASTTYNLGAAVTAGNMTWECRQYHTSGATFPGGGAQWTPTTWITGTGYITATNGTGNSDTMVNSDVTHPSQVGHDYLARCISEQIIRYFNSEN